MRLHGNAALSLTGRRRLVRMVIEEVRSIAAAAEAAGVSDRPDGEDVLQHRGDLRRVRGRPVEDAHP